MKERGIVNISSLDIPKGDNNAGIRSAISMTV